MVTFSGELGIKFYTAVTLASGLRLYARAKIKPNRNWTPTNMIMKANEITGHTYRRGQYEAAADGLIEWADRHRAEAIAKGNIQQ